MLAIIEKLQKPLEGKADEEKIIRNGLMIPVLVKIIG